MQIAIIGCGNMGKGLAACLSKQHKLFLYDHNGQKALQLEKEGFGKACESLKQAIPSSELVLLAIKPQSLKSASDTINAELNSQQILVSLLAGTPLSILEKTFPKKRIIRMMPNLPLIYGEGVIGLSPSEKVDKKAIDELTKTFEALGKVLWLPEAKIEAISALAGSGPAFIFVMIESMIDAGIAMGFNAKDAQDIVLQTIKGSVSLIEKSEKHPAELKWQITSPEGTTIAGIKKLEEQALRSAIINTFLATYNRAKELAQSWKD